MIIYTAEDLANKLQVSSRTIVRAAENGFLKGARIGNKWRFTQDNLLDFLEQRTPVTSDIIKRKKEAKKRKVAKMVDALNNKNQNLDNQHSR